MAPEAEKSKDIKHILPWVSVALAAVLAAFLLSRFCFRLVLIRDDSMAPAYQSGMIAAMDVRPQQYHVGDVVVFYAPGLDAKLVKRVSNVQGDVLTSAEAARYGCAILAREGASGGYRLQAGEYIVLGDNAEYSVDSRDERVGIVHISQIEGKLLW